MANKQNGKSNISKRGLVRRIRLLVAQISLAGLISIIILTGSLKALSNNYSAIVNENYKYISYVNILGETLYQHQTIILEHMAVSSSDKKAELEEKAEKLEETLWVNLDVFGIEIKGQSYETLYHSIYSGIGGYLKNVDIVLDFSNNREIETANYYMETALESYITEVNGYMDDLDTMLKHDLDDAKRVIVKQSRRAGIIAVVILVVIVIGAVWAYLVCKNISNEMVNVDAVTGIANQEQLVEIAEKRFKKGNLKKYALVSVNIKSFQYINQQIGTEYGDLVLKNYAEILDESVNKNEMVARITGDNFVALIEKERVEEFVNGIKEQSVDIRMPNGVKRMQIQSRIGVYQIEDDVRIKQAMDYVQVAVREARKPSANDCAYFSNEMFEHEVYINQIIANFRTALDKYEFLVYYQPKVDMRNNTLCGCEALVRWMHEGKLVPPMDFIPILEEKGLVVDLDFYVFDRVCRDISRWKEKEISPVRISSNFSKMHLQNPDFADKILEIVEKYKVDTKYIEVEITESSGYDDFDAMTEFVARMKEKNIFVAIDDFGTGYSSLSMLMDLDVDVVKLDKSFLRGIDDNKEKNGKMIENIVRMIRDLKREVICEGVETDNHVKFLTGVDCFVAQGYFYDKPLPHDDFEDRLKNPVYNVK